MAFPWKLLARLVSPRRQERQEHDSADDVKPDVLAIAKPTETAADNGSPAADRPADERPVAYDQSEAVSADPHRSEETASGVHGAADMEGAMSEEVADPALFEDVDGAARDEQRLSQTDKRSTRKRSRRGRKEKIIEVVPPTSPGAPAVSDDAVSLDKEIRRLRVQLTSKLQLQNAQLKRMLERFER
jgi:hypothetical protein